MTDPTAELQPVDEVASDLDAAIAAAEAETPPEPPPENAVDGFVALQYALLEEVRRLLDETNARSREILATIFDPQPLRDSEHELERMIGALAEPEIAAEPEPPAAPDLASLEELEAALLAREQAPVTVDEPPVDRAETPCIDEAVESPPTPSLAMRLLDRAAAPLRVLASPLRSIPAAYRPIVGIFALTLFLWYPAIRLVAGEAAAASRVRPLTAVELDEISSALRATTNAAETKAESNKAEPNKSASKK